MAALTLFGFSVSARAACELEPSETHRVVEVIDGDTVLLDDGREVRLTGIQAPKLPLGRSSFEAWPLAEEARDALVELVANKAVTLHYGGATIDRHGRVLAQAYTVDKKEPLWLQQEMLRRGLARVYTFSDNRACAEELLRAERDAREAGREIWADAFYRVRDAADESALEKRAGRFELVEGEVISAALVRGRIYLNFGEDYRKDFTVTVEERDAKLFLAAEPWLSLTDTAEAGSIASIAGKKLRVRGWIEKHNGPEITVTHPEQIEWLSAFP
ncbi:nuclease (SNase domain protein) [Parvibaculum lavamentivorans DS-1]|uniref:Nuclease (SNase domain protein) n=1 Tax=Parvibaculum lavamentivorans (strain DS-1 / DSM 13023 / NCIMB 13966) TaxID=402881 RepID=A7HTS7_PARL1|nr:thermonuclease family protein [Parvibaculum lavamentivorans]ABS63310.1 nuclease (SNase domain protein) [Parvibaculum lavamentivorans DS-1]